MPVEAPVMRTEVVVCLLISLFGYGGNDDEHNLNVKYFLMTIDINVFLALVSAGNSENEGNQNTGPGEPGAHR